MRVMTSGGRSQEVKASTGELIRDNISARRICFLQETNVRVLDPDLQRIRKKIPTDSFNSTADVFY